MDGSKNGVWVTWSETRDYLPSDFHGASGLLIRLESAEDLSPSNRNNVRRCTVMFLSVTSSPMSVRAKIAFIDGPSVQPEQNSRREIEADKRQWMPLADFRARFGLFVLSIGDRGDYEKIFRRTGPDAALRLLRQAGDLVVLNELRPASRILRQVRTSPHGLWSEFFREDEEKFALIDLRRTIEASRKAKAGLSHVDRIEADVSIWGGHFVLPLTLSFPEVLGQRQLLNVVIGPNGSGKTNLLLGLARSVVEGRAQFGTAETDLYEADGTDSFIGPERVHVAVFTYERALWGKLRSRGVEVFEQGVRASDWRLLTQLILQIIASGEDLQSGVADLRLFSEILSGFIAVGDLRFPLHRPSVPSELPWRRVRDRERPDVSLRELTEMSSGRFADAISRLDRGSAPLMRADDGRDYTLSSGERSLVLFSARLMNALRHGALVLIDEPENHLHPRFITLMIQTLARTLQATGSRALVVTHSPFVVREVERSTVKVMKTSAEGVPEIFRPSLQTLGADVAMISDYVFEDEKIRKGFQESIDRAIRVQQYENGVEAREIRNLASELGDDGVSYLIDKVGPGQSEAPDA